MRRTVFSLALSTVILAVAAVPAQAAVTPIPAPSVVVPNVQISGATAALDTTTTTSVTVKGKADAAGTITLRWERPNGPTAAQKRASRCVSIPVGTLFRNSARDRSGHLRWFWDRVKPKMSHGRILRDRHGKAIPAFVFCKDSTGQTHKSDCWNFAKIGRVAHPPVMLRVKVIVVRHFVVTSTAQITKTLKENVQLTASCVTSGSSASASVLASLAVRVSASASASGEASSSTLVALNRAKTIMVSQEAQAKTALSVNIAASLKAKIAVMCVTVAPVTVAPVTVAPVNHAPVVQLVNAPQHVFVNGQIQVCALASDSDHDQLLITWSARYGTVSTAFRPDPLGAPQTWCTMYTAPGLTHSDEVISVTATDSTISATASSTPFPVVPDQF